LCFNLFVGSAISRLLYHSICSEYLFGLLENLIASSPIC
jgi:hypothetical protein